MMSGGGAILSFPEGLTLPLDLQLVVWGVEPLTPRIDQGNVSILAILHYINVKRENSL